MRSFNIWLEENHFILKAYDKHANMKHVFTARASSDSEVEKHIRSLHAHVKKTGRTHRVTILNTKTGEHSGRELKQD